MKTSRRIITSHLRKILLAERRSRLEVLRQDVQAFLSYAALISLHERVPPAPQTSEVAQQYAKSMNAHIGDDCYHITYPTVKLRLLSAAAVVNDKSNAPSAMITTVFFGVSPYIDSTLLLNRVLWFNSIQIRKFN